MEKWQLAQNAIDLVKKATNTGLISENNLEIGAKAVGATDFSILSFVSDADVRKFIVENHLTEPQNLVTFLVETYFGQIESIISTINHFGTQHIRILVEKCDEANHYFLRQKYDDAERVIMDVLYELQASIKGFIEEIQAVEKLRKEHPLEFIRTSRAIKKNVISYNENAKYAITAYFRGIDLLSAIYAKDKISDTKPLFENFRKFCEDFLLKDAELMRQYDYNCEDGFWDNLPEQIGLCSNLSIEINRAYDNVKSVDDIIALFDQMDF